MSPSLVHRPSTTAASDFERLKDVVLRLSRGEGGTWTPPDSELAHALNALALTAPSLRRSERRAGVGPSAGAEGRAVTSHLVLVRVDRFEALQSRVGEPIAGGVLDALRDQVLLSVESARIGRVGRGVVEFVFEPQEDQGIESELTALHQVLEQPVTVEGEQFALPIVLGATPFPAGSPLAEAVRQAQRALSRAEAEGVRLAVFCEKERADASERLALMRDLREGLAGDQLSLAYQPKLNVRSGRIDAVEALIRWRHPVRGMVPPDQFIALAEDTGDIARITERALTLAIRDQATLAAAGRVLTIYVNLSGRLVTDEGFCQWVREACAGASGRIGLEITETAVIADPERALRNLRALAEAGIDIAIDDYGSGLSSLAYLKALPARELKIDRAFVHGLSSSQRDPLIVRSTIDLAHALQMQVTAEGVDDPAAFALLRVMGCDRVQGYLISPPLDLATLQTFLEENGADGAEPVANGGALLSMGRRLPKLSHHHASLVGA